jgi:hypothetical protein
LDFPFGPLLVYEDGWMRCCAVSAHRAASGRWREKSVPEQGDKEETPIQQ